MFEKLREIAVRLLASLLAFMQNTKAAVINWKKFLVFVVLVYASGIAGSVVTGLVPRDWGLLTTLLILLIPVFILYYVLKKFRSRWD